MILSLRLRRSLQFLPEGTGDGPVTAEVLETSRMIGEAEFETAALETTCEATVETVVGTAGTAAAEETAAREDTAGAGVGAVGGAPPAVAGRGAVAGGRDGSAVKSG
jgi:hypothetical protein